LPNNLNRRAIGDSATKELATRRSQCSALLRSGGIDALIASLNTKADDLPT
jgi:hypothetical protein